MSRGTGQSRFHSIDVNFSIVLSPTYQVPVLWFTVSQANTPVFAFEKIYEIVVAPTSHEALHQIGVIGGISMAVCCISNPNRTVS